MISKQAIMELTLEELIRECERRGLKVTSPPTTNTFTVIARYDRGLGPEYVTLREVVAKTIAETQEVAQAQAERYFATTPGYEQAILNEVRIRPNG
jgi:hypothetical protein